MLASNITAAIMLAKERNISDKTKHLCMRINYIHQEIVNKNIQLVWVDTHGQVADLLTKPLSRKFHEEHSEKLTKGFKNKHVQIVHPDNVSNTKRRKTS